MSRSSRQEKAEKRLRALEQEFENLLVEALHSCAGGRWGLFWKNEMNVELPDRYLSKEAERLIVSGDEIVTIRQQLGIVEEFWPYARLRHYRSLYGSNVPGEPKLAQQFLEEINQRATRAIP